MLHAFISANRDEILARTMARRVSSTSSASTAHVQNGVPLFLTQLAEALRLETTRTPLSPGALGATATKHGRDLLTMGFTVSQVVHAYGDVCQAITEIAADQKTPIDTEEFRILNGCLDIAIAAAVTEYQRMKEERSSHEEVERLGQVAHELRNLLQSAMLSFEALKSGRVGIAGSTGALLGRSLIGLQDLIDRTLSEVRLATTAPRRDRVSLLVFVDEIAVAGRLHAEYRKIGLHIEPVEPSLAISVDPPLLASAVMNLLQNAFKYSRANGEVTLRTRTESGRVFIEVEDQCGGLPPNEVDPSRAFGERRSQDRSGLGLGLSITRKAVQANGGELHQHDLPGRGCIFAIALPLA